MLTLVHEYSGTFYDDDEPVLAFQMLTLFYILCIFCDNEPALVFQCYSSILFYDMVVVVQKKTPRKCARLYIYMHRNV